MGTENLVYQIKVTLRGIRPSIWRRFIVPKNISLHKFHIILQVVIGWSNSHLYQFRVGNIYYGIPDDEWGMEIKSDKSIKLEDILMESKDRIIYEYDFGEDRKSVV